VRVLIIHQHFNTPDTGGPLRSYYLAKALLENGIQPIVITAHLEKAKKIQNIEGIEVHYLPVAYENRFGFYQRGWSFTKFILATVREAGKLSSIDLCYAISTPLTTGVAAQIIKRRFKIPYVFEVGDLWPDAPVQLQFVRNKVLAAALYRLEKSIYKNANSIVALSVPIKNAIEQKAQRQRVHVIPNMSDITFYEPEEKKEHLVHKFNVSGKFVVSYIGAIGIANGLEYYIDCARVCQQANLPVHFFLCGDGALKSFIQSAVINLGLKNITIYPFQNREGVRELLSVTDTTFVCYKPFPILETGSPNKYFDGLAAGKLILINFNGWIKEEIEREQCGVSIDSRNPADIIKKITPFISNIDLLEQHKRSSRNLACKKYAREILGKEYADLINNEIRSLKKLDH
jgi:glycosyltransferase involved in cell wall biosynthesis